MKQIVQRFAKTIIASPRKFKTNFVVAGTQKGGTTALGMYLQTHPQICIPQREVHFFDREKSFYTKFMKYPFYHSFFEPKPGHKVIGERTPIYMYWMDVPRRIWEYNPKMKIILILRNPIERAFSHWNMEQDRNIENIPFWDALQKERERCRITLPYQHRFFSYVDKGFYTEQIRRIWRFFPSQQTLILKNEHLRYNPRDALESVTDFLGIDSFQHIETKNVHSRRYEYSMTVREKDYLIEQYEHEIRALEETLGWDCQNWLN